MPKTKFQNVVFTLMMSFLMVYAMICYNISMNIGGANIKVIRMFEDMKEQVKDWKDEDEVRHYLQALLDKQAFDRAGLIYGMGHAVYSLSAPTCRGPR